MGYQISPIFEVEKLTWENIGYISLRVDKRWTETDLMDVMRQSYLDGTTIMVTIWRTPILN